MALGGDFDYSPGTARSYLSHLGRQGLLGRAGAVTRLRKKATAHPLFRYLRLPRPGCPFAKGDGAPNVPQLWISNIEQQAKIRKEKDYLLVVRQAGVYCDRCSALILDEIQARQIGIRGEG